MLLLNLFCPDICSCSVFCRVLVYAFLTSLSFSHRLRENVLHEDRVSGIEDAGEAGPVRRNLDGLSGR